MLSDILDVIVVARRSFARSSDSSLPLYGLHPHAAVRRMRRAKTNRPAKRRLGLLPMARGLTWASFVVLTCNTGAPRQTSNPAEMQRSGTQELFPGLVFVAINTVSRPSQGQVGQPAKAV